MPRSSGPDVLSQIREDLKRQVALSEQVRLLYANSTIAVVVSIVAATLLCKLQWGLFADSTIIAWWLYMTVVSVARFILARSYWRRAPGPAEVRWWRNAFTLFTAMSGGGWGGAGILLYPAAHLTHQIFLIFVLGGVMLGAAFLLAPRPETFLAFLLPTGLLPSIRFFLQRDQTHLAMGLLAMVFTLIAVVTTARIYRTIDSLLRLQSENRELVEDLQLAKDQTDALNQELELRVEERTAELHRSNEQLRTEIEQREQMEEELLRARKLESLGVLAGGIAHDFNNFLTVVQGNIELARMRLSPADPAYQALDQSAKACQRAAFLSSQLLTFAKGGVPVRRVVSIGQLVLDAVQLARAGAPVSIAVEIAPDLRLAEVDPNQIGQVLQNILLNARQAMPEGGIIEVRAENAPPEGPGSPPRIRISIRDYGSGIAADALPRIFDPYFTTKPGGSGLGLATAHSIIAKHQGHIAVDSKEGEGTLVIVDLPASEGKMAAENPAAASPREGNERILVMDDEEALRTLLETILKDLGYQVEGARDGAEAVAVYEEALAAGKRFDAVILDLTVSGGMGGMETAAKLKEIDPESKLIVSSGYSDSPVMSDFGGHGFDAVIPKPWTSADVTDVLRKVLVPKPQR